MVSRILVRHQKKINIRETPNSKQTSLPFASSYNAVVALWGHGRLGVTSPGAPGVLVGWHLDLGPLSSRGSWEVRRPRRASHRPLHGESELGPPGGRLRFAQPPGTGAQASGGGSEATNELGNSSSRLWPLAETVQLCPGAKAAFPFPHQARLRLRPSPSQTCGVWRMKQ